MLPAVARVHTRASTLALRAHDALLHLNNACQISNDAVTSPRAAKKAASPPVPGNAFLEDVSSEYGEKLVREYVRPTRGKKTHVATVIGGFIKKKDFDGAELARMEFLKMDIPIEPDMVYITMLTHSLTIHEKDDRYEKFFSWLPLLPPEGLSKSINRISMHLLRHPFDLDLLRQFCIFCAQAGMISELCGSRVLHHIFRYGNPHGTQLFLRDLEDIARAQGKSIEEIMGLRNLAIRMYYIAGRRNDAEELLKGAKIIEPLTRVYMERNSDATRKERMQTMWLRRASRSRDNRSKADIPTPSELAVKLRLLRRAVLVETAPPYLESNLADFIFEYVVLAKRKRAFFALRRKVFQSSNSSIRSKWVAAEQLFYSSQHYPMAILRAHLHYCVADHVLASEVNRVFDEWTSEAREKAVKSMDCGLAHDLLPISTYSKVWPTRISLALTWKAVIQLSSVDDLERLYQILVNHVKALRKSGKKQEVEREHNESEELEGAEDEDKDEDSPPPQHTPPSRSIHMVTPPAVFPTAAFVHHFVVAMSTRISPLRGAKVIAEMQQLELKPSVDDWGTVAGAYARSGDVRRLAVVLKHVDKLERAKHSDPTYSQTRKEHLRKRIIIMHNSAIRGLTECGMYRSARKVQERMQQRGYFKQGIDVRTKAILHRLSRYEKGHFDSEMEGRRTVRLKQRPIRVLAERVQWKDEKKEDSRPPWKQNILQDTDYSEWWYHEKRKEKRRAPVA